MAPESPRANAERERYRELLEELRTVLPGVQVLLGFLLTAPFATRFPELSPFGLQLFGVAVSSAALATILLIAPASYHRLTRGADERPKDRRRRLRFAISVTLIGLSALAVSIVSALLLVVDFVFGSGPGGLLGGAAAGVVVVSWYLLPLWRRWRRGLMERDSTGTGEAH